MSISITGNESKRASHLHHMVKTLVFSLAQVVDSHMPLPRLIGFTFSVPSYYDRLIVISSVSKYLADLVQYLMLIGFRTLLGSFWHRFTCAGYPQNVFEHFVFLGTSQQRENMALDQPHVAKMLFHLP